MSPLADEPARSAEAGHPGLSVRREGLFTYSLHDPGSTTGFVDVLDDHYLALVGGDYASAVEVADANSFSEATDAVLGAVEEGDGLHAPLESG